MNRTSPDRVGLSAALVCYLMWGLLPILFQALERAGVSSVEIVAWRTVFGLPCALLLVLTIGQWGLVVGMRPRTAIGLVLSAALIAINWLVYVWAVGSGRTLEASLGYYINPLLNMAAGRFLFGEKIDRWGWAAIALASAGVILQAIALNAPPWVSLILAFSFGGYGIVRKRIDATAQTGLLVECAILTVPAVAFLIWTSGHTHLSMGVSLQTTTLLGLAGPATVIPLALFAIAARRLPLTFIGFLQFISPTIQFVVGVQSGEALTPLRAVSFVFIWGGAVIFGIGAFMRGRAERLAQAHAVTV